MSPRVDENFTLARYYGTGIMRALLATFVHLIRARFVTTLPCSCASDSGIVPMAQCSKVIETDLRAVESDQPEMQRNFSSTISRK